jgi:hypothetical protein
MTAPHPLQIVATRHWKIGMPFKQALEWGSGTRPATTRLIVELTLANGIQGYDETICLLESIEPVLLHTVFPIALQHRACDVERFSRNARCPPGRDQPWGLACAVPALQGQLPHADAAKCSGRRNRRPHGATMHRPRRVGCTGPRPPECGVWWRWKNCADVRAAQPRN